MTGERSIRTSALFSTVFGSNFKSDGNVPAGDHFVKIDVNSFPVLTRHREELKLSLSHAHTLAHAQIDVWENTVYEILLFCAFFVYSFNTKLS